METVQTSEIDFGTTAAVLAGMGTLGAVIGGWLRGLQVRAYERGRKDQAVREMQTEIASAQEKIRTLETQMIEMQGRHDVLRTSLLNWRR